MVGGIYLCVDVKKSMVDTSPVFVPELSESCHIAQQDQTLISAFSLYLQKILEMRCPCQAEDWRFCL